jgi:DNA polymerase/3'-5' exonuclease PolX
MAAGIPVSTRDCEDDVSEGKRFEKEEALKYAARVIGNLVPAISRIEIAGSLRRGKDDVGDIEIVCIPRESVNLLGEAVRNAEQISSALKTSGYKLLKDGEHFKQFFVADGLKCDLFITTPECWGVIFTIRTGSAEFSHKLVTQRKYGGYLPSNLNVKDGRVWNGSEALYTPEEKDLFDLCRMWVEPKDRM